MSDGNLLLFGLCMNRIGCVSITCYTVLKKTIYVGSFHVLKPFYKENKLTIYMRTISKMATTNMTSQVMCSLTILYAFSFLSIVSSNKLYKTHIN